ncbi:MAG: hypothetical protein K2J79_00595, partial [Ruminiclostridium sp.]|nr:hypothetical protein [Ruminiclostridium sp.]
MIEGYGTLQEAIGETKDFFKQSCDIFPCAPLAQSGYMLENTLPYPGAKTTKKYHLGYSYVSAILIFDII